MLKGQTPFHFTPFPDKTNEQIFLKSPKKHFGAIFEHFWSFFSQRGFFQKKQTLSHISPYRPLTPYKVLKKNKPISRKLSERKADGQTKGRTEGQALIDRTLPATSIRLIERPRLPIYLLPFFYLCPALERKKVTQCTWVSKPELGSQNLEQRKCVSEIKHQFSTRIINLDVPLNDTIIQMYADNDELEINWWPNQLRNRIVKII